MSRIPKRGRWPLDEPRAASQDAEGTLSSRVEALVARYGFRLLGLAVGQVRDPHLAEEVVQDVLFHAYRLLQQGRPVTWAWLARGVVLRSRSEHRRSWWRRQVVTDPVELPESLAPEGRSDLLEAVHALPTPYREATLLYYWAGFEVREIAEFLRIREGTVKSRLSRSRDRLREWLGDDEGVSRKNGR